MKSKRLLLLSACSLLFGLIWVVFLLTSVENPALDELAKQQKMWLESDITHYLLVIEDIPDGNMDSRCTWEMEVIEGATTVNHTFECSSTFEMDGRLVSVHKAGFTQLDKAKSVSDIFHILEEKMSTQQCGPNGCDCDGYYDHKIEYHPEYGYPATVNEVMRLERNLIIDKLECFRTSIMSFQNKIFGQDNIIYVCKACTALGYGLNQYNISVAPIP